MIRFSNMSEIEGFINYSTLVIQVTLGLFIFSVISIYLSGRWGAPWIITPQNIIHRMLDLGNLQRGDRIADLGAGDGRILISAARDYGAVGFGVEIDPIRVLLARFFIWRNRVHPSVKIHWGNLFKTELHQVNVVIIYLTRETNQRLKPFLEKRCDLGTRVISYAFPIPGWSPVIIDDKNLIFVYDVGNTGDDVSVEFV